MLIYAMINNCSHGLCLTYRCDRRHHWQMPTAASALVFSQVLMTEARPTTFPRPGKEESSSKLRLVAAGGKPVTNRFQKSMVTLTAAQKEQPTGKRQPLLTCRGEKTVDIYRNIVVIHDSPFITIYENSDDYPYTLDVTSDK